MEGEGDGRRAGVAAWRERVREEEQGCKFPFPLRRPLPLAAPPPRSSAQLAKQQVLSAAQQISSEERQKLFPFLFFPFLRWPANVILHTRNGLAVSSTNFRGDNLTFTPPSLHPPPPPTPPQPSPSLFLSLPPSLCFSPGILSEGQVEEAVDSNRMWRGEGLS